MRRPNPRVRPEDALAAWDGVQPSAASARVVVKCELMTPMYGGGVEPGKVDRAMPIRPSAIRGQLRFWWRLLNGAGPQAEGPVRRRVRSLGRHRRRRTARQPGGSAGRRRADRNGTVGRVGIGRAGCPTVFADSRARAQAVPAERRLRFHVDAALRQRHGGRETRPSHGDAALVGELRRRWRAHAPGAWGGHGRPATTWRFSRS